MYRAKAEVVEGRHVLAGGRRLLCIGNENISPGDMIWTDGRCVYGHHQTGGAPYIPAPALAGIPLLMADGGHAYYSGGSIHPLSRGEVCRGMVNRGDKVSLIEDARILDAELDTTGGLYLVEGGSTTYDFDAGQYVRYGRGCISREGEMLVQFEFLPGLEAAHDAAVSHTAGLPGIRGDHPDVEGDDTRRLYTGAHLLAGKVTGDGDFSVVLNIVAMAERVRWADSGNEAIDILRNVRRATYQKRVFLTPNGETVWAEGYSVSTSLYTGEFWSDRWMDHIEDDSFRIPLQDGYTCTFAGTMDYLRYPSGGGEYTVTIYGPQGEAVGVLPGNPLQNMGICPLGEGAYLVSRHDETLYLLKGEETGPLNGRCRNFRLRRMKDLRKWKGE